MREISIERDRINLAALDEALRAAMGEHIAGLSFNGAAVRVHLADTASADDEAAARVIVQTHDATVLTAAQQAALDRQQALAALRALEGATPINPALYAGEPALIQALAAKIAWLEQEINVLRIS